MPGRRRGPGRRRPGPDEKTPGGAPGGKGPPGSEAPVLYASSPAERPVRPGWSGAEPNHEPGIAGWGRLFFEPRVRRRPGEWIVETNEERYKILAENSRKKRFEMMENKIIYFYFL